ncbi:MAG: hypothetical protein ACFFFG_18405 [Candidatus Thorarchaeota archaeon]
MKYLTKEEKQDIKEKKLYWKTVKQYRKTESIYEGYLLNTRSWRFVKKLWEQGRQVFLRIPKTQEKMVQEKDKKDRVPYRTRELVPNQNPDWASDELRAAPRPADQAHAGLSAG